MKNPMATPSQNNTNKATPHTLLSIQHLDIIKSVKKTSNRFMQRLLLTGAGVVLSFNLIAQGGPPPPPPLNPLNPPIDPIGNPSTADKIMLGKTLYWDEQMSSTKTVACASCHIFSSGGTDPRANNNNANAQNPGFDGIFDTEDDITGSPGVSQSNANGLYEHNEYFAYDPQVTGRKAPSVINIGYANELFWDGRAGSQLIDPISQEIILANGGALESQVLGPPVSSAEMGHSGRSWSDVLNSIERSSPMALSPLLPPDMQTWIGNKSYYQLFEQVFGSTEITASKVAMSIASYERSLYSDQSPFDEHLRGNQNALNQQERNGLRTFARECAVCHSGGLLSDNEFHNLGVSPNNEDPGRFIVTGDNRDRGLFKTPPLRNLENRASFMHTGGFSTLEQVLDFYDRGGDFNNPNLDPRLGRINLSQNQKNDLLAFLRRPLTDLRVSNESGPFTSPMLYSESNRTPIINGSGITGTDGKTPIMIANQPPLLGNNNFTVAIENAKAGSMAVFAMSTTDPGTTTRPLESNSLIYSSTILLSADNGDGHVSTVLKLPTDTNMKGETLYGRWYVTDQQSVTGYAVSPLLEITLFSPDFGQAGQIFKAAFE